MTQENPQNDPSDNGRIEMYQGEIVYSLEEVDRPADIDWSKLSRINYPERARRQGIEGKVMVSAIVTKTGQTILVRVFKGIGGGCDEEAKRVVDEAVFTPAKKDGVAVHQRIEIPIIFRTS